MREVDATPATPLALRRFAWGGLAYVFAVVLWGAFVRATGSGAGCGDHWPLCNGVVLPRAPALQTIIELTHRVTSGLALLFALALPIWTFRRTPRGHPARSASVWTLVFMLTEAAVGAGLVLFKMVADNESIARGWWMSAHLVNTFLLLGAATLAASFLSGDARPRVRAGGTASWLFGGAFAGMMVLGVSGAVAALGDTLFPATTLAEGWAQDLSSTAHVFLRLRILHPVLAFGTAALVLWTARQTSRSSGDVRVRRRAAVLTAIFGLQLAAGLMNVLLLAPVWMQLLHLLLADLVWVSLVRLAVAALAEPALARAPVPEARTAPAP